MARLTPARFVALYDLAVQPGSLASYDKRTAAWLLDAGLVEWCDTTEHYHVYRATSAALPVLRDHLEFLEKREAKGRMFRSDNEQDFQTNAAHYRAKLDDAANEDRPETPADRIATVDEVQDEPEAALSEIFPGKTWEEIVRDEDAENDGRDDADAAPFGSTEFADAVIRAALDAPAPLPTRAKGRPSRIAAAGARYRTPLPVTRKNVPMNLSGVQADALVWAVEIADRDGRAPALYLGPNRPFSRTTVNALVALGLATGSTLPTRAVVPLTEAGIAGARRIQAARMKRS